MKLNTRALQNAQDALGTITDHDLLGSDMVPATALVVTGGLMPHLDFRQKFQSMSLDCFDPYNLLFKRMRQEGMDLKSDHARVLRYGYLGGKPVLILDGRLHLYEVKYFGLQGLFALRLIYDTLLMIGVRNLIVTSAVGSCTPAVEVGRTVIATEFIGTNGDLTSIGEHPMIETGLDPEFIEIALSVGEDFNITRGVSHWVTGPGIESPLDKENFRRDGASVATMSGAPAGEAVARWIERIKFDDGGVGAHGMPRCLIMGLVTNGVYHDSQVVGGAMNKFGGTWGDQVNRIVQAL